MRARSPHRFGPRLLALLLSLAVLALASPLRAEPASDAAAPVDARDARAQAEALFARGDADDAAFAFARAIDDYEAAAALDPRSPRAAYAATRVAALRAHAEGDFVPYEALERLRRTPSLSMDPRAVDALVRDAETFPPGLVRLEVWVVAAEAYQRRFDRPRDAEPLLARVEADPQADLVVARKAARELVALRLARGDLAGAAQALRDAGPRADPELAGDIARAKRRRNVHLASIGLLLVMALAAARACFAAARRGDADRLTRALAATWKLALAYGAYVALAGALLASGYEEGTARPFLHLGLVLVPIVLVARVWAAAGGAEPRARAARAVVCGGAVLGAAMLVLERIDVAFLAGVGL